MRVRPHRQVRRRPPCARRGERLVRDLPRKVAVHEKPLVPGELPREVERPPLHPVVYSLKTTFAGVALSTAPARRLPELDSHAIATSSSLGAFMAAVISLFDPHALPSQIHAFASLSVTSAPINPTWSLPFFGARSISAYWMSAAWPVSSRQF